MAKKKQEVVPFGLVHVFGEDGVGKTTLSLTCGADPEKSVFIDCDSAKSHRLVKGLGWQYIDLLEETDGMEEIQFYQYFLDLLGGLPDGLDAIVIDNAKYIFNAADSWFIVGNNWKKYRKDIRGSDVGMIAAIKWRTLREEHLPRDIYAPLARKAKIAFIISHEKEKSDSAGVKTGAMEAAADKSLRKAADLVIRLTRSSTGHPAPVGLVIKNINRVMGGDLVRVFPPRIAPCTWDTIRGYVENPAGDKTYEELAEHEVPNTFEQHLIKGSLTPEQQRQYEFYQALEKRKIEDSMAEAIIFAAQEYDSINRMAIKGIVRDLSEQYPNIGVDIVERTLEAAREE